MSERKFLLYCPVKGRECLGDFWGTNRLYDIAINDWDQTDEKWDEADYVFRLSGHKWPCSKRNLPQITKKYEYYAFFDNDVQISTEQLNHLFLAGKAFGLDLFQAALNPASSTSYEKLLVHDDSLARMTSFVEIMMPVFSAPALDLCLDTFDESESGYGLDFLWAHKLRGENMGVIDTVSVLHTSPCTSSVWRLSNGLTPMQELEAVLEKYKIIRDSPPPPTYRPK